MDTDKTSVSRKKGELRQRSVLVSSRSDLFQLLNVGDDFRLKIPDFVERAFGKYGEVSGIFGQEI